MIDDLKQKFIDFAIRMVGVAPRCANEEGTEMFLVLPFLSFIGYDISNHDEVCSEHNADFSEKYKNRVDHAILKDSSPVIAVECKSTGAALRDDRGIAVLFQCGANRLDGRHYGRASLRILSGF